jgi:Zn-dependent metalloprotease
MKKLSTLFLIIFILSISISQAQTSKAHHFSNWENFDEYSTPERLVNERKTDFGLGENEELTFVSHSKDALAISHYKYQQYHEGIPIEGGEYLFHVSDSKMWGNGRLVYGITATSISSFTENEALDIALNYFGSELYFWEDDNKEALIKYLKSDADASFYPNGELIYGSEEHSQDGSSYQLLWKFEIFGFGDKMREYVYVNALSGEIQYTISGVETSSVEGTANTRYHGEQSIISDSLAANQFQLYDATRGGGIVTYDLNESEDITDAVPFEDEDNYWDNANTDMDEAAGDVHWGLEMVYDYYLTQHGRDSYDGNGAPIVTYVHYGNNYFNAFWLGIYGAFGDGSGNPLTYIDVVAHEFTHGVTKNSAGLIYSYETGALNESFSDIMGTSIEFFAFPDGASWEVGILNFTFRSMEDPNLYGQPDTYLGSFWATGSADYGGAHTNSGVQNYWFYLLSEGGSGVNDNGDAFTVEAIGIESAADITYRNLTSYLTTTSTYEDARQGSIQSAIDLYGECSNEVLQVIKAWHAVGMGSDSYSKDLELLTVLSPQNNCDLGSEEIVEISMKYNHSGCSEMISAGTSIDLFYQLDNDDPVMETFVLAEDLNEGDVFSYTFDQSISLPEIANEYELNVWMDFTDDEFVFNNELETYSIERKFDHGASNMGFESLANSPDSIYISNGKFAQARLSTSAENTGNRGFLFSAYNTTSFLVNFAESPDSNFTQNPEYVGKLCFCVDAQEWDHVSLYFDMKQTYSMHYLTNWGNDSSEYASSMRMLINGEQFGEQFHPTTNEDDPYLTYSYSLDQLAGTYFEYCFQSKNYINSGADPIDGSPGDNTFLDNVRFVNEEVLSVDLPEQTSFSLFPNPSTRQITLISEKSIDNAQITIVDAMGRLVYSENKDVIANESLNINISRFAKGVYTLRLKSNEGESVKQLLIQ